MTEEQVSATLDSGGSTRGWTPEVEELLREWRSRCYAASSAYYKVGDRLRIWHYCLGIPVVIFSAVVGSALFAGTRDEQYTKTLAAVLEGLTPGFVLPSLNAELRAQAVDLAVRFMLGAVSLLAGILASVQTFFRFGESANAHGVAGDWYAAIRRDIELMLALPTALRPPAQQFLDGVRKEMNKVAEKAPELKEKVWRRFAARFDVREPMAKP